MSTGSSFGSVSVHDPINLLNAETIVYLQHAIQDGSARNAIEGLARSGDNYDEVVRNCQKLVLIIHISFTYTHV